MTRRTVWVISPFSDPTPEASSDRYRYICQQLTDRGAKVCQFISAFNHTDKQHRTAPSLAWRCVTVQEPGYITNVSIKRLISHACFDLAIPYYLLREWIRTGKPDTLLVALPHNGAALLAGIFAKIIRARLIVDVHDTWPESILSVTRIPPWKRPFYQAWKALADGALLLADTVYAESNSYAGRADQIRHPKNKTRAQAIYLGGDLSYYQSIQPAPHRPINLDRATFVVAYVGTLGANYDLDTLLMAFGAFHHEHPETGLMLLGGGEREHELRAKTPSLGFPVWISGRIPHRLLISYLKQCQVGFNGFKAGGNVAYSYKLNDYLLAGIPVVNSLIGESTEMISIQGLGYNYVTGDPSSLLQGLRSCYVEWKNNPNWRERVLSFAQNHLDRQKTYDTMLNYCLFSQKK